MSEAQIGAMLTRRQMYTTNELLTHPLVSPVLQPTLGGLPPLLIMVGGGELLRDEQIYLAHKCANPKAHLPPEAMMDEKARAQVERYKPTNVQLQVWDDLCHVGPTLSFTRPAKFMYRVCFNHAVYQKLARADLPTERCPIRSLGTFASPKNRSRHPPRRRNLRHLQLQFHHRPRPTPFCTLPPFPATLSNL
jgi:acetyl esterase/lipase